MINKSMHDEGIDVYKMIVCQLKLYLCNEQ
jgi:hypothetical protein